MLLLTPAAPRKTRVQPLLAIRLLQLRQFLAYRATQLRPQPQLLLLVRETVFGLAHQLTVGRWFLTVVAIIVIAISRRCSALLRVM